MAARACSGEPCRRQNASAAACSNACPCVLLSACGHDRAGSVSDFRGKTGTPEQTRRKFSERRLPSSISSRCSCENKARAPSRTAQRPAGQPPDAHTGAWTNGPRAPLPKHWPPPSMASLHPRHAPHAGLCLVVGVPAAVAAAPARAGGSRLLVCLCAPFALACVPRAWFAHVLWLFCWLCACR